MTLDAAYLILDNLCSSYRRRLDDKDEYTRSVYESLSLAKQSMYRDIAKQCDIVDNKVLCPCCNSVINFKDDDNIMFCPICGQKLER